MKETINVPLPRVPFLSYRGCVVGAAAILPIALAGCAMIPSSGPTGGQVRSQLRADTSHLGIALVEVRAARDLPPAVAVEAAFSPDYSPPQPTELVGVGDVLDIAIYEAGIALFGGSAAAAGSVGGLGGNAAGSAHAERLPPARVSDEGTINVPYIGEMKVRGRTTAEVERMIRQGLRGKSENPQVLVSIQEGLTNSVIIGGDVGRPGRLVLPTNRESLTDVIALAGGVRGEMKDTLVRVQRGEASGEFRLSDVMRSPLLNIRIFPSDRISLVQSPRSFSALGATGRSERITFPTAQVSLAEAVAMAGGSNPATGDARAVFVFRTNQRENGQAEPVVYHFNMMEVHSYLLAQSFTMSDKDVLYIGNAEANQPTKLVQIVSQLFFPLVLLQNATGL